MISIQEFLTSEGAFPDAAWLSVCVLVPSCSEEYFNGLIARTAQLTDMTEDDLKAPANGDTVAAAVPTILAAGLVAMLTAVSA